MSEQRSGFWRNELEPPAYDTLSIAPPAADFENAEASGSSNSGRRNAAPEKKSLRQRWGEFVEEEWRKKDERIQHVSKEEADRITGLDKLREQQKEEAKKKGARGLLGFPTMAFI